MLKNLALIIIGLIIGASLTASILFLSNFSFPTKPGNQELLDTTSATSEPTPQPTMKIKTGSIEGAIGFPSEVIPEQMIICAEDTVTYQKYCTSDHVTDSKYDSGVGYIISEVPIGVYFVYAQLPEDGYRAYYNEFVTCGLSADCASHKELEVVVKDGETTNGIDPQDWYNRGPGRS